MSEADEGDDGSGTDSNNYPAPKLRGS